MVRYEEVKFMHSLFILNSKQFKISKELMNVETLLRLDIHVQEKEELTDLSEYTILYYSTNIHIKCSKITEL